MYFAVIKLVFEDEGPGGDGRDLRQLVEKIRGKFKVAVAAVDGDGGPGIAVAALASTEERLSAMLDKVADFCEDSGFGRIASEHALMDHLDSLQEESQED